MNLYAHDLAALFAFGAWMALERAPLTIRRAAARGVLTGLAVLTEYETGIILVVLAAYVIVRHRERLRWFVLGAVPPLAVLACVPMGRVRRAVAHAVGLLRGHDQRHHARAATRRRASTGARRAVRPARAAGRRADRDRRSRGGGLARDLGRAEPCAGTAIVGLAVLAGYLALCVGWSGLPILEEPGPRDLIPALPFLAVPLAAMWERLRMPALLAAAVGAMVSVPAAFTYILLPHQAAAVPGSSRIACGFTTSCRPCGRWRSAVSESVLYGATVVLAVAFLVHRLRAPREAPARDTAAVGLTTP